MKKRKRFTPEQKAAALRRHLVDRIPISQVCEEAGIQPAVFYRWQKTAFEALPGLFEKKPKNKSDKNDEIAALRQRLARKDEVIAEITEDFIAAKKKIGEL